MEKLKEIHNKMETSHGNEGEVSELKIKCECIKHSPSMLLKAADDLNIDLS